MSQQSESILQDFAQILTMQRELAAVEDADIRQVLKEITLAYAKALGVPEGESIPVSMPPGPLGGELSIRELMDKSLHMLADMEAIDEDEAFEAASETAAELVGPNSHEYDEVQEHEFEKEMDKRQRPSCLAFKVEDGYVCHYCALKATEVFKPATGCVRDQVDGAEASPAGRCAPN